MERSLFNKIILAIVVAPLEVFGAKSSRLETLLTDINQINTPEEIADYIDILTAFEGDKNILKNNSLDWNKYSKEKGIVKVSRSPKKPVDKKTMKTGLKIISEHWIPRFNAIREAIPDKVLYKKLKYVIGYYHGTGWQKFKIKVFTNKSEIDKLKGDTRYNHLDRVPKTINEILNKHKIPAKAVPELRRYFNTVLENRDPEFIAEYLFKYSFEKIYLGVKRTKLYEKIKENI